LKNFKATVKSLQYSLHPA